MISGVCRFCQGHLPAITSTLYIVLFFLATVPHVSAQSFLGPFEESCGYRKAQGVIIKLLAVYASHVLTIKISPGQPTTTTIQHYAMAALLPSSSAYVALLDLFYRRSNFSTLAGNSDEMILYRNMQKAINAGAVCRRVTGSESDTSTDVLKVGTRPLEPNQTFIMVPRGTDARCFKEMLTVDNPQYMKAFVGTVQLGLAMLQLVSVASNPQVAAYGCGSFTYTIIPYAIGSIINLIAAIFTPSYVDLMEFELKAGVDSSELRERVRLVVGSSELASEVVNKASELTSGKRGGAGIPSRS